MYDPKKADIQDMNANLKKRKWAVKRRTIVIDAQSESDSKRSYEVSDSEEIDQFDRQKYRS